LQEWIRETLNASEFGLAVLPAAFLMGLLASVTSCCTPAVLGVMAGYSGSGNNNGRRANFLVGTCFLIGTIVAVAALGAVAGLSGQVAGTVLGRYWKAFAGLLAILFGLVALNLVPFRLPKVDIAKRTAPKGLLGASIFGFAVGGTSIACAAGCNPLIAVPLGVAVLQGDLLGGTVLLVAVAVGYGLPFAAVVVGLRTGFGKMKSASDRAASVVKIVAGITLIAAGFYMLATV